LGKRTPDAHGPTCSPHAEGRLARAADEPPFAEVNIAGGSAIGRKLEVFAM